ncbi:unnamed protein product [Calicophoron daubneyi]|uniref:RRM domain-containing protein n=1 Tax=Calicophoron daubneyi TaxID=300641 RepID=A0AAV2T620_CALDB
MNWTGQAHGMRLGPRIRSHLKVVKNAEPKANERGLEYPSNSEDLIEAASIAQHDPHRLWLGGIPPRTTEYAILQLTRQFGQLSDFHFPVHRAGELQGSTVGYCFVTYKEEDAASKALKLLNGLNFHGHRLVARHAHPTRDEITIAQRASEEAARLRIAEQARLCETKLAARLMQVDGADLTTDQCGPVLILSNHKKSDEDENTNFSERPTEVLPDMCGKLGRIGPSKPPKAMTEPHTASTSSRNACNPERPSRTTAAINRIESALRHLEKNPVGGVELLQPSALKPPLPITYSVLANAKARNAPRGGYSHSRLRSGGYHQGSHYIGERGRRSKCTDQTKTIYSRL